MGRAVEWAWEPVNFFCRKPDRSLLAVGANSRLRTYSNKYGTLFLGY